MSIPLIVVHLLGGFGIGLGYFAALWWAVRRLVAGRAGWAAGFALVGRFAIFAALLAAIGWEGTGPLLATGVGVLAGRLVVLRHVREAPAGDLAS